MTVFSNLKAALKQPDQVQALILRDRKLRALPEAIADLPHLERLDVSINPLGALPDWLFTLPSLRVLRASCVGIDAVPEAIGGLSGLEELSLGGFDGFTRLPDTLAQLTRLRTLDLTDATHLGALPELPGSLRALLLVRTRRLTDLRWDGLPPLEELSLDDVGVDALPDAPGPLAGLRRLRITGSALTRLPDWVGTLDRLTSLYLEDNEELEALPDALGGLGALTELYLGLSKDLPLPASLGDLARLKRLSLVSCQLTALPPWLWRLGALRDLYVALNPITEVPPEIAGLTRLARLDLGYNPEVAPQRAQLQAWLPGCEVVVEGD